MNYRLRFSIFDDLCLLREVVTVNPYEDGRRWDEISKTVVNVTGKNFSLRSLKEHTIHLLKLWLKDDTANIRKSGTEEQYKEKEQLLQEVNRLVREFRGTRCPDRRLSYDGKERLVEYPRTDYNDISSNLLDLEGGSFYLVKQEAQPPPEEESMQDSSIHFETPPLITPQQSPTSNVVKKRKIGQLYRDCLLLMKSREQSEKEWREQQQEIEKERLAIKRKKLELEEEKFKLEKEEKLMKLQMEKEERQHRMEQERCQNVFCEKLMKILENKLL